MGTIGKIFHVNFLGFSHWFMSIRISQLKGHYISVDQDKYATSVVAKYIDTDTINKHTKFHKTNFPSDVIFTKYYVSTSDEQVEKLSRESNIYHRACIISLIYILSIRVYLSFYIHKLAKFS